jgi:hypothetical protein
MELMVDEVSSSALESGFLDGADGLFYSLGAKPFEQAQYDDGA